MSELDIRQIDAELRMFTTRNFEKPSACRNLEQVRFYVQELCEKIEDLEMRFNYAPQWAYALLAQYNSMQNSMIHVDFRHTYS